MQAEKLILETDEHGELIDVPRLPPRTRFEAILLVLDRASQPRTRQPPPELRGSVTWMGDPFFASVVQEDEWEASIERTGRQIAGDPEAFE